MNVNKDIYQNMINRFDVEIFSNIYYLKNGLQRIELIKTLILINKFYPSYTYKSGNLDIKKDYNDQIKWEDIILNDIPFDRYPYLDLYFNIPIFIQVENQINLINSIENGIGITLEEDERFGLVFIINIYPNVYTNVNYYSKYDKITGKWYSVELNQIKAARKNREILANFLKELEGILKVEINNYESIPLNNDFIYKYGFKDNVVLPR
ncbi:hypothetical protein [Flavobacterium sp.]|uniref:hypothetical protein n=1 Tax=Flavobacterium sp. TaxID=239 RepID=UPI0040486C0A